MKTDSKDSTIKIPNVFKESNISVVNWDYKNEKTDLKKQ